MKFKVNVKRILALAAAMTLVVGIVACDGNESGNKKPKETVVAEDPTEIPDEPEATEGTGGEEGTQVKEVPEEFVSSNYDPTKIEDPAAEIDWSSITSIDVRSYAKFKQRGYMIGYQHGIDKFAEEMGVAVTNKTGGMYGDDPEGDMASNIAAGTIWNLQFVAISHLPDKMLTSGLYTPLSAYIDWEDSFYDKEFMKNTMFLNEYYGIANEGMQEVDLMVYNPKDFELLGLETPRELYEQGKWNFEKILEYASITKVRALLGVETNFPGYYGATAYELNESGMLTNTFISQGTTDYFKFYETVYNIPLGMSGAAEWRNNTSGDIALITSTKVTEIVEEEMLQKFLNGEREYVPYPASPTGGASPTSMNGWMFSVPRTGKNIKASIVLAQYMCNGMADGIKASVDRFEQEDQDYYWAITANPVQRLCEFPGVRNPFKGTHAKEDGLGNTYEKFLNGMPYATYIETENKLLDAEIAAYNEKFANR